MNERQAKTEGLAREAANRKPKAVGRETELLSKLEPGALELSL
jgi:hypothetical protein